MNTTKQPTRVSARITHKDIEFDVEAWDTGARDGEAMLAWSALTLARGLPPSWAARP